MDQIGYLITQANLTHMKSKWILFILLFSTSLIGIAQEQIKALIGVDIFNGKSEDLKGMTILIQDGLIKKIFKNGSEPLPDSAIEIELNGYYVIPGLIDTHVHMGMKDLSNAPDASRDEFKRWIYSGVTTVRDMGGDARALANENQLIKENKHPGPDIYFTATVGSSDMIAKDLRLRKVTQGIGIENAGYVIEAKEGMDLEKTIAMAVASSVSGVKFYAGVDSESIKSISEEANKQGLKSWSHFTVFPDRPIEVVRSGVNVVSHMWGAFWQDSDVDPSARVPFTHTDFKGARSAIYPDDMSVLNTDSEELQLLFKEMNDRDVIWDLTYVIPNPEIQKVYKEYALAASQAGVSFCTGTDYFNPISESFPALFKEIEGLVEDGILDSREVLLAATLNGAKAIGIEKSHGTIEVGKAANLVVLKKSPVENISNIREIEFSMKNGIRYDRSVYDQ